MVASRRRPLLPDRPNRDLWECPPVRATECLELREAVEQFEVFRVRFPETDTGINDDIFSGDACLLREQNALGQLVDQSSTTSS